MIIIIIIIIIVVVVIIMIKNNNNNMLIDWLTKGRTALLLKDKSKGNIASKYRPITCLPFMWKFLSSVIADQIYGHSDQEKLLPEEQKGCRKRSRGTNDLLNVK